MLVHRLNSVYNFNHLKLYLADASHSFKWLKF